MDFCYYLYYIVEPTPQQGKKRRIDWVSVMNSNEFLDGLMVKLRTVLHGCQMPPSGQELLDRCEKLFNVSHQCTVCPLENGHC